ncbi:MAG: pentapeptide repeat-containing protein [Zetaproteobacteria bacterium]|nr:pentapeptide repeat-containing protein [Zetaproteobacteria bacterium]
MVISVVMRCLLWMSAALGLELGSLRAASPSEELVRQLAHERQQRPQDPGLAEVHSKCCELLQAYQQAQDSGSLMSAPSAEEGGQASSPCPACHEACVLPTTLETACGHELCESCTLRRLQVHQGALAFFLCWHPGCRLPLSLLALGTYLGRHGEVKLLQAALKYLIRQAGVGAQFCPRCGDQFVLPTVEHGYSTTCSACQQASCFACGKPPHAEIPCEQVEDTQQAQILFVRELVSASQMAVFGFCPHCMTLTEFKDGCEAMVCGQNAEDKVRIPFTRASQLAQAVQDAGSAVYRGAPVVGCGRAFSWGERVTLGQYLQQHDPAWSTRHAHKVRVATDAQAHAPILVVGQRLTRTQLDARLAAGLPLAGANLRGIDLEGLDLASLHFAGCWLDSLQLQDILRAGGSWQGVNIVDAQLDLRGIDLRGRSFAGTRMMASQAVTLLAHGASLVGINLSRQFLGGYDLTGADLRHADLTEANLSEARLVGVNTAGANFRGAILGRTQLLVLYEAGQRSFRGVDLMQRDLRQMDLREADFRGADFQSADLRDSDLRGADLRRADLRDALLEDVDLRGANLLGARLDGQAERVTHREVSFTRRVLAFEE